MKPNDSVVESLLRQMELTSPSIRLDQAIGELSRGDLNKLPQRSSEVFSQRRFGWKALVSTAVAACVFGLFLGQFVSIYPGQRSAVANADFSDPDLDRSRNILPVRFSVDAFEMMHGHSRQAEFANCMRVTLLEGSKTRRLRAGITGTKTFLNRTISRAWRIAPLVMFF